MMVDFETQPGAPKQFVIDGVTSSVVETMMAVADRFEKTGTVRAITAEQGGSIVTPEGTMRFGPGDMIVSDEPPTHAWPVRRDIFERTYRQIANAIGEPLDRDHPGFDDLADLTGERDATKWAAQFVRIWPGTVAEDVMVGWFANAIESGVIVGSRQPPQPSAELETTDAPAPTGEDAELYQPDPATITANPDNGPDFERVYDGFKADDEEDVTGITDEELVEEVPITSEDPIPPNELVRQEDTTGTVLRQKRKGRGNRR